MITIDTHVIIWLALQPEKLSTAAKSQIDSANRFSDLIISDITIWEIAMLVQKGRIQLGRPFADFIRLIKTSNNLKIKPITPEIAELAVSFGPEINGDPSDRIICATSIINSAPLVTADENLRKSVLVKTIW
jgi:PIN domain nuclease of toxin-antitoxin system